jgi:dephospho-CoA kinase
VLHVGLTGGLASGKSFVGKAFEDLGCLVIRMDELGHQALEPGGAAYAATVKEFQGELDLLNPDGSIDRRALGAYVFAHPDRLERLNAIVHPAVRARGRELAEAYFRDHPDGIAVTEAAILIETGSYKDYDRLILAVCRPEQQIERALARSNAAGERSLTREEVLDRMRRQIPLDEKRKYADYVIDTSGSKDNTLAQTRAVYESLRSLKI